MTFAALEIDVDLFYAENTDLFSREYSSAMTATATTITLSSTEGIKAGVRISGSGIPSGTTVSAVTSGTVLTLSAAATQTQTVNVEIATRTDTELKALKKDLATSTLKIDLRRELRLIDNSTGESYIDDVCDRYEDRLEQALRMLQTYFVYKEIDGGEGSKSYNRMNEAKRNYNSIKSEFTKMQLTNKTFTNLVNITRG